MRSNVPKLSQKTMTKLLGSSYRKNLLQLIDKKNAAEIRDYAKYVTDGQILQRMAGYENDSKSGWGFPQLNILSCFKKDGSFEKKFFEFKAVNHFLKEKDGDAAAEVVACILWLWKCSDSSIASFDYEKIDAELVKIDREIAEKQAREQKISDTGKRICDIIRPTVDAAEGKPYDEVADKTKVAVERMLDEFVKSEDICKYVVSLDRNNDASKARGELFLDIGYKLEEGAEFTVLACHVNPKKADEQKEEEEKKKQEEPSQDSGVQAEQSSVQ